MRNPYASCHWAVERKPPSFRAGLSPEERLHLIAQHWSNAHRIVLEDAASTPGVAAVRFEDFLAGPERVVRALCEFLGLEFGPAMVPGPGQALPWATLPGDRKWHPLYADDRLDRLTAAEAAIVGERCRELAERFGYEPRRTSAASGTIEALSPGA